MSTKPAPQVPSPKDYIGYTLWCKANKWAKYVNQKLEPYNLVQSDMYTLIAIGVLLRTNPEVTQSSAAKYTGMHTMAVSKIVRKLEKKELITRHTSSDPRAKALSVTPKGWEVLIATTTILTRAQDEFFPKNAQTILNDQLNVLQS